jgi:hypothetical protein
MVSRVVFPALTGVLLLLASCNFYLQPDPVVCLGVVSRAIEVEVRDAATGQPAADGTTGIARDGNFVDTLSIMGWTSYPSAESALLVGGAEERPGIYSVRVEKEGYQVWERTNLRAEKGPCGVITVRLEAHLMRAEG